MATSEIPGLLKYKDENGNINLLLPITTKDNVDGLDEIEAELNETLKYTTQELNDAQKAQARANIGVIGQGDTIDSEQVIMPDGSKLSDVSLNIYKVVEGASAIEPGKYYDFGVVDSLNVELVEADDTIANEYCFEFVANENFGGLTITPEPRWAVPTQFIPGKTHQVSILRGIGVMVCA